MWRALLTEGTPNLPATMSFESVAMSCLVTSLGELLAEPGADEAAEVAGDVLPAFEPGPHLAVGLPDRRLHPLDPLLDDLVDGLAPSSPARTFRSRKVSASAAAPVPLRP